MLTTCPECHTSFRVGQAQLDSRRGLVRCGRCSAVFNAYDTLLPELAAPPEAARDPPGPAAAEPAQPSWDEGLPSGMPVAPEAPFELEQAASEAMLEAWSPPPPAAPVEPIPETTPALEPPAETPDSILLTELPTRRPRTPPPWQAWLWGLASVLLALLFGLQLVYFLRLEIAAGWPDSRPLLAEACRRLGCSLPLSRDLTALRIETSSLESDPEDNSRAVLHLSLSNRSGQAVDWPHLLLTLTDVRDVPIALRPFKPREYLPAGSDPARGIAPGQEQEVRLELELKGLTAYGYKLDKQYP